MFRIPFNFIFLLFNSLVGDKLIQISNILEIVNPSQGNHDCHMPHNFLGFELWDCLQEWFMYFYLHFRYFLIFQFLWVYFPSFVAIAYVQQKSCHNTRCFYINLNNLFKNKWNCFSGKFTIKNVLKKHYTW